VQQKWLITPEWNQLELNQTDGKVEVTEELLADAETINTFGDLLAEGWESNTSGEGGSKMSKLEYVTMRSKNDQDSNATWLLDELEGPAEVAVPPSDVKTVTATMKIDGKLGWEYFPGYYLLEGGLSYSPYSRPPIQEDEIEPAEGEFTVDLYRYIDACSSAEKLGFVAEAERLGIPGYID
jgi:hypothetical protein